MEKYFDLHGVSLLQKICITSSYLEEDQFLWYKGLCSRKQLVTWSIFTEEIIAHYENTKRNTFIRATPQQLKEKKIKRALLQVESKIMATRNSTPHNYKYGSVAFPSLPQPTRITPQQLEEKREKGLCYNCDSKCIKGHKCAEKKLFYIEYEEEKENDQETLKEEDIRQDPTPEKEVMNPKISYKALARITTRQTLKIEGHIKKKKVQEVKDHIEKEEMNPTIYCNALAKITTPQTIKKGHIKKKNVQEVKDQIEHQEINPTIFCKALEEMTTPQNLKIEGHIKKKKVQTVKYQEEKYQETLKENDTHEEPIPEKEEMIPTISCNAFVGITTPQTVKIEGHIKKTKIIMLIDSSSTHNFINCKISKDLNCFLDLALDCQVTVVSGGTINCFGKCHNIKLSMGEYVLNSPMFSILMGGADVVLGV